MSLLVRQYTRHELPRWWNLLQWLGIPWVAADESWSDAPTLTIRGKFNRYFMDLDLSNWSDRRTYFLGRYYDLPTQLLILNVLRPGDRMVDIGSNIGMIALVASRVVGEHGVVDGFEPNPVCCARLCRTIDRNGIRNIRLHQLALGARKEVQELTLVTEDSLLATLTKMPESQQNLVKDRIDVMVERGDDILLRDDHLITLIKIDVEGFECPTLSGLDETIKRWRPVIVTEVESENLARADAKPEDIWSVMNSYGYEGYYLTTHRRWLRHRLALRKVGTVHDSNFTDVAWLHPQQATSLRARRYII